MLLILVDIVDVIVNVTANVVVDVIVTVDAIIIVIVSVIVSVSIIVIVIVYLTFDACSLHACAPCPKAFPGSAPDTLGHPASFGSHFINLFFTIHF